MLQEDMLVGLFRLLILVRSFAAASGDEVHQRHCPLRTQHRFCSPMEGLLGLSRSEELNILTNALAYRHLRSH